VAVVKRLIAILVGVVLLAVAAVLCAWTVQRLVWPDRSSSADGVVLSVSRSDRNQPCCAVDVSFVDDRGTRHEFHSDFGGSRSTQVGDSITVYYDPDDPSSAETASGRFKQAIIPAVGAISVAMVGAFLLLMARRKPDRDQPFANAAERLLDKKTRRFEAKHSVLMEELKAVGHEPRIHRRWTTGEGGGASVRLICAACGERRMALLPESYQRLSPTRRCRAE
jgi:hypothetical protein